MYFAFRQLIVDLKRVTRYCLFDSKFTMVSRIVFVSLVITACFGLVDTASAILGFEDIGNILISSLAWLILALAKVVMSIAIWLLEFFIEAAAYNGYSDAPPVLLGWFMVRDVANMFFVIALLVIAFGTILGLDNYEWKKTLGKLIIAAILINFSKLIAQFIIDVAHVFTMTFLNAVSATAGGNLIAMFNFDKLFQILPPNSNPDNTFDSNDDLRQDIAASAILILTFSIMSMVTIGAYTVIMVVRMCVLWVAIILSPLAYILSVLPPTQRYAGEYWNQFINYVIAAPVMVFFLWLAFASFGSGNIATEIGVNPGDGASVVAGSGAVLQGLPSNPNVSLSKASTWENMSSFIIAIIFLLVGIERVQALNVRGGSLTQTAVNWGKATVAIASGYAAGRFLYDGIKNQSVDAAKDYGVLLANKTGADKIYRNNLPLIGAKSKIRRKEAVAKISKLHGFEDEKIKAESLSGLNKFLSPSGKAIINAKLQSEYEQEAKNVRTLSVSNVESGKIFEEQKKTYEERLGSLEESYKRKEGTEPNSAAAAKLQRQAAKGLNLMEARIVGEQESIEQRKGDADERKFFDQAKLSNLTQQRNEYDARKKEVMNSFFDEKVQERISQGLADGSLVDLGNGKFRDTSTNQEVDIHGIKSEVVLNTPNEEIAEKQIEAATGLSYYSAFLKEGEANKKTGKMGSETTRISAIVADQLRLAENKDPKKYLDWQKKEVAEEAQEWTDKGIDEILRSIGQSYRTIQKNGVKKSKNAVQNQTRAMAAAMRLGWGNYLGKYLASLDSSFEGIDLTSTAHQSAVHVALATGAKADDLFDASGNVDVDKASKKQEDLRVGLKEKSDILLRGLMEAADASASNFGKYQHYKMYTEGLDANGNKVIGNTAFMHKGVGVAGQVGTGSSSDGAKTLQGFQEGEFLVNATIQKLQDARSLYKMKMVRYMDGGVEKTAEVFTGFLNDRTKAIAESLAQQTDSQIAALPASILNGISGGTYGKSSLRIGGGGKAIFHAGKNKEVRQSFQKTVDIFRDSFAKAVTDNDKNEINKQLKKLKLFFGKLDTDDKFGIAAFDKDKMRDFLTTMIVSNKAHYER